MKLCTRPTAVNMKTCRDELTQLVRGLTISHDVTEVKKRSKRVVLNVVLCQLSAFRLS